MLRNPRHRRLLGWLLVLACVGTGGWMVLDAFRNQLVFFYSPSEWKAQRQAGTLPKSATMRLGGLVKQGTLKKGEHPLDIEFIVTDLQEEMTVRFHGLPPALFREGQGVVAEGRTGPDGVFRADRLLAKHDEKYMPPEVAKALKKSGQWQHAAPPEP